MKEDKLDLWNLSTKVDQGSEKSQASMTHIVYDNLTSAASTYI